jgi:hypothetical protein
VRCLFVWVLRISKISLIVCLFCRRIQDRLEAVQWTVVEERYNHVFSISGTKLHWRSKIFVLLNIRTGLFATESVRFGDVCVGRIDVLARLAESNRAAAGATAERLSTAAELLQLPVAVVGVELRLESDELLHSTIAGVSCRHASVCRARLPGGPCAGLRHRKLCFRGAPLAMQRVVVQRRSARVFENARLARLLDDSLQQLYASLSTDGDSVRRRLVQAAVHRIRRCKQDCRKCVCLHAGHPRSSDYCRLIFYNDL